MIVTLDIKMETRMEEMEICYRETQSSITKTLRLLTPGKATKPSGDVTLVPESLVGGDGK